MKKILIINLLFLVVTFAIKSMNNNYQTTESMSNEILNLIYSRFNEINAPIKSFKELTKKEKLIKESQDLLVKVSSEITLSLIAKQKNLKNSNIDELNKLAFYIKSQMQISEAIKKTFNELNTKKKKIKALKQNCQNLCISNI